MSLAGKGAGMDRGSGTRSGMLWEVERILLECKELNQLPQVLVMENVPQVHSKKHIHNFEDWIESLDKMGYKSYWQDLIATKHGIPQTRKRTFMVSVLGNYTYDFPKEFGLTKKLKDLLEIDVEDKYYLSDQKIESIIDKVKEKSNIDISDLTTTQKQLVTEEGNIKRYITSDKVDAFAVGDGADLSFPNGYGKGPRVQKGISPTLTVATGNTIVTKTIPIPEATKKGYKEAYEGDGVYINRPAQKRGCVQDGMIQTLKTTVDDVGVVVRDNREENLKIKLCNLLVDNNLVKENDIVKHSYSTRILDGDKPYVEMNNISPTLTTRGDCIGVVVNDKIICEQRADEGLRFFKDNNCGTLRTIDSGGDKRVLEYDKDVDKVKILGNYSPSKHNASNIVDPNYVAPTFMENHGTVTAVYTNLRIRKLTVNEAWRLMGVKDEDFDKVKVNQSNASLFHLAGDSIVTTCLMGIFGELLGVDYIEKINDFEGWWDNER